jgi:hypothetical protein
MSENRESLQPGPLTPLRKIETPGPQDSNRAADEGVPAAGSHLAADAIPPAIVAAYKLMLLCQFGAAVVLSGGLTIVLWVSYSFARVPPPLLVLIMLAGMLGALFSGLTRLYNVDQASGGVITSTVGKLDGWYMAMYSLVPSVIGAIAAVVLYLIFVGKLIEGGVFPVVSCPPNASCITLTDLMNSDWPATPEDYGKALVWAFAAGFSERLVPDLLRGFVTKQTGNRTDKEK